MNIDFFDIKSSRNDTHYWDNRAYKMGKNSILLPESPVISLHSSWTDMHFNIIDRKKYTMYLNLYDVHDSRETRVQSGTPTVEFSLMLKNQIYNKLGALAPVRIKQGSFNITYVPFVDSIARFEKDQVYYTLDIHLKKAFLNELRADFPSVIEPMLDAMEHKAHWRMLPGYMPCTRFMLDLSTSIQKSLQRGPRFLPLVDKDVHALIAHAIAYQLDPRLSTLDINRMQLINEVYHKITSDLMSFPDKKMLAQMAHTNITTLNKRFRQAFNTSMMQCWISYRLDEGLKMVIHERDKKIAEIAKETGYNCIENFTKAFTAKYNSSPSSVRKQSKTGYNDLDSFFQTSF